MNPEALPPLKLRTVDSPCPEEQPKLSFHQEMDKFYADYWATFGVMPNIEAIRRKIRELIK